MVMRALLPALLVSSIALSAQAPQRPPLFRAGTDVVEVDAVVHDRNGAFVADLSADDFIVEEAGQPQPIQQFYLHLAARPGWAVDDKSARPAAAAPAEAQSVAPRVFVVVFDDEHLSPAGFKRTQAAALTLFQQQFRTGDAGGVVAHGRMVKDRLTTDREELLKAVKDAKPNSTKNSRLMDEQQWPRLTEVEAVRIASKADRVVLEEVIRRACSDDPKACERIDPEPFVRSKAAQLGTVAQAESMRTLQMLRTLATGLANMPGRKTVLLLSEGFLAEDEWPMVAETVTLAARANARIYTLDARGGERGLRSGFEAAPSGNDSGMRMLEQMDFGADSVNSLAVDTGGFVVRNTNQFDKAIARIGDDAGNYYVLGIRPAGPADGKFHRVSVTVKRSGVTVRARRGYVALPQPVRETNAATPAATAAPALPVPVTEAAPPIVEAVPEPAAVEATLVPHAENTAGLRVRPDAAAHASTLAGSAATRDADATAGWDAYQRGDVETARTRLAAAAARNNSDSWVLYTLGMSNYALRQFRDAAAAWERVRSAASDFEPVYFDLIDAYLQMRDHDQATRIARAAMARWPSDPELANALGVVQTSRGALDDAVKSFQAAVSMAPADATGYFNLGKALELRYFRTRRYVQQLRSWMSNEGDRSAAIENYERYLELRGPYADAARAGLERLKWMPTKR